MKEILVDNQEEKTILEYLRKEYEDCMAAQWYSGFYIANKLGLSQPRTAKALKALVETGHVKMEVKPVTDLRLTYGQKGKKLAFYALIQWEADVTIRVKNMIGGSL